MGNSAEEFGGAVAVKAGSVEIYDAVVKGNRAASGGGVSVYDAIVSLVRITATGNAAVGSGDEAGVGGFFLLRGEEATGFLTNSSVGACTASARGGGVATSHDAGELTIDGSTFSRCKAGRYGGAVSVEGHTLTSIRACDFDDSEVNFIPDDVCLTLTMEDVYANGWAGAQLRIFAEDDYVGDEVYGCVADCKGADAEENCDKYDFYFHADVDDDICMSNGEVLDDPDGIWDCDCSGCRCNGVSRAGRA